MNMNENIKNNYTLVTAFFDIGRKDWNSVFARSEEYYLENGVRLLSLPDPMIVFVDEKMIPFVSAHRRGKSTWIFPIKLEGLDSYKYLDRIKKIMESPEYRSRLVFKECPECSIPEYDVVMFGKFDCLSLAIDRNPFATENFAWIDFGIHRHMLQNHMLNAPLLRQGVQDPKIKILCRSYPRKRDLDIETFYTSHSTRLLGAFFSGSKENFKVLIDLVKKEIEIAISKNVIDSDQSILSSVFLKNQELFSIYCGDSSDVISNYYNELKGCAHIVSMIQELCCESDLESIKKMMQFV